MDELEKAALEAAANAVVAPIAKPIIYLIGVIGGDRLSEIRAERQERRRIQREATVELTRGLLINRKVEPDADTPRERVEEILDAAQNNSIPELRDLFARLAAAAVDPKRQGSYRREFVTIVNKLEPLDAVVLPLILEIHGNNYASKIAEKLGTHQNEVKVSARNLQSLGCIQTGGHYIENDANLTPLGSEFLRTVMD